MTKNSDVPAPPVPLTYGAVLTWSDQLLDVIGSCNADKAAIRELEARRIARGITP